MARGLDCWRHQTGSQRLYHACRSISNFFPGCFRRRCPQSCFGLQIESFHNLKIKFKKSKSHYKPGINKATFTESHAAALIHAWQRNFTKRIYEHPLNKPVCLHPFKIVLYYFIERRCPDNPSAGIHLNSGHVGAVQRVPISHHLHWLRFDDHLRRLVPTAMGWLVVLAQVQLHACHLWRSCGQ